MNQESESTNQFLFFGNEPITGFTVGHSQKCSEFKTAVHSSRLCSRMYNNAFLLAPINKTKRVLCPRLRFSFMSTFIDLVRPML